MPPLGQTVTERLVLHTQNEPLQLHSGARLGPVEVAYESYGRLNRQRSNAVFVCHALTGDAHAAGHHSNPARRGWWDNLIGPGRGLDTDRFFVVCANLLGGCQGTTGPSSPNPDDNGRPYGLRFPHFNISDLVTVHRALLHQLEITRLTAAIGGSLGGMQVLQWALDHPDDLERAIIIAAAPRLSAQNIAFSTVARAAILNDSHFHNGDYYTTPHRPDVGLALARMLAHITYLSPRSLEERFGRQQRNGTAPSFQADFEVEHYLQHQGESFLQRFDANSYLYLSRVMDYFDPFTDAAQVRDSLHASTTRFLILSFTSDWRFPTSAASDIHHNLQQAGAAVTRQEIASPHGHDSFLLPLPAYHAAINSFLTTRNPPRATAQH